MAELLLIQGRFDDAARHFHYLLQQQGSHAKAHLGLARLACRQGDWEVCFRHLDVARTDPRTQKAAYLLLAEIHQRRGNPLAAEAAQRRGVTLPDDPTWPDPFVEEVAQLRTGKQAALERADRRLRQGRIAEALTLLQDTVRDYPDSDWAWYLMGKAFNLRHEWQAAEQALGRAARLSPESAEIQFHRGVAFFQLQNLSAAAACFRKATQLRPDYDVAYFNLGQCLHRQGDRAGAIEAYQAALRCEPNLAEARAALADLHRGLGEKQGGPPES